MKKTLKIVIITLLLALIAFMGYKVINKINYKKEVAEHIKTIPEFSYKTTAGKTFTKKDLKENIPTVFLYFNSECEHCQSEAIQIQENIEKFADIQLVFISFEEPKKIMAFAKKYKIDHYDTVTFLCDKQVSFATAFDVKSIPTVVIYDKNKKLLEKIKGEVKIDNILKKLKK
ncbi:peroxiredoxin family protein [Flavobacterium aestuarii]|uniref:peroxiredoxin family protein n=1 Tax=Flavobacterium aestuarii TaxID=3149227 RepID=UPI0032B518AE